MFRQAFKAAVDTTVLFYYFYTATGIHSYALMILSGFVCSGWGGEGAGIEAAEA